MNLHTICLQGASRGILAVLADLIMPVRKPSVDHWRFSRLNGCRQQYIGLRTLFFIITYAPEIIYRRVNTAYVVDVDSSVL